MFRFFFKRLTIKRQRQKTVAFYKFVRASFRKTIAQPIFFYNFTVLVTLPKRQQFFIFYDLKKEKFLNISAGRYLLDIGRKAKFFKRQPQNIMGIVLHLKKIYPLLLQRIYLYSIPNFNYRQFLFYKRFKEIINPEICYLFHAHSFMPKFLPKRRIKRRVLKLLRKQ